MDASGKQESGVAGGNFNWFGSYSVCQNISGAQYCLAPNVNGKIAGLVNIAKPSMLTLLDNSGVYSQFPVQIIKFSGWVIPLK